MYGIDLKSILLILHLIAVIIGAGSAFAGDNIFFNSIKRRSFSSDAIRYMKMTSNLVWVGLSLMFLTGFSMFLMAPAVYLGSDKFLLKMVVIAVIALNGLAFKLIHMNFFEQFIDKDISDPEFQRRKPHFFASGGVSAVSWLSAIVLGSLYFIPVTFFVGLLIYLVLLIGASGSAVIMSKFIK
jgi:hypothetical protein